MKIQRNSSRQMPQHKTKAVTPKNYNTSRLQRYILDKQTAGTPLSESRITPKNSHTKWQQSAV